jgi:hypothetical protein
MSFNNIHVYDRDARDLANDLNSNALSIHELSENTRFDRFDVSNIIDSENVGTSNILSHWAPLFETIPCATIIGYFVNWSRQADQLGQEAGKKIMLRLIENRDGKGELNVLGLQCLIYI